MNVKKQIIVSTLHVTDNGKAVGESRATTQAISYIPYGEVFVEQQAGGWSSPYLFNAKEFDSETGLYYYGARYLDPSDAMWLSVDPLWEKYVGMTPYQYCMGNPVAIVDPNGRENIVVCGSQYDESAGNKLMFVNQGIRALKEMAKSNPNETRTMLLFKEGYTDNQITEIKNSVRKFGGSLKIVNSASEMIDYVNNKNGDRSSDKVSNMELYSHGLNGSIEFGYLTNLEDIYRLSDANVNDFNKDAFKGLNSNITSYACRTALGNNSTAFCGNPELSNSFAQNIAKATGTNVFAYARRTNYSGTLGSSLDRHPLMSFFMPQGVIPYPIPQQKNVDGAVFTPNGANRGVVAGDTPIGLSVFKYHFKP